MKTTQLYVFEVILVCLVGITFATCGQNILMNGLLPSPQSFNDSTPVLILSPISSSTVLPFEVDNSLLPFFPHVPGTDSIYYYNQDTTGSCVGAAFCHYAYTYEFNRINNTAANDYERIFSPNFLWNYFNEGLCNQGIQLDPSFKFMKAVGFMSVSDWGTTSALEYRQWVNGYEKYSRAMSHKLENFFQLRVEDDSSLNILKHYIADHNEGAATGGIPVLGLEAYGDKQNIVPPSAHAYEPIWVGSQYTAGHAIVIAGYCDSIAWDFNGDGIISSNDSLPMEKWERGAVKLVNSCGPGWWNYGFIWLPYRNFAVTPMNVYFITPRTGDYPELLIKCSVSSATRKNFAICAAGAPDACHTNYTTGIKAVPKYFNRGGGDFPLSGYTSGPVEFAYDWGFFLSNTQNGKIFSPMNNISGEMMVHSMSLVDLRWNEIFELPFEFSDPFPIPIPNWAPWSIDYHLLPFEMAGDTTFLCNMVSRFNPTVHDEATLTLGEGINVDLYNSEIHVEEGGTLIVGNNVTFHAKRGVNQLVVDGNIQIGTGVKFVAEENIPFLLIIKKTCPGITMNNILFDRAGVQNFSPGIVAVNCTFTGNQFFYSEQGNLNIDSCAFNDYFVSFFNNGPERDDHAIITNSYFTCINNSYDLINLSNYQNFLINGNNIHGGGNGITISHGGYGGAGYHHINGNSVSGCQGNGISIINSAADLTMNHVFNCNKGVCLYDNSLTVLKGNQYAQSPAQTQYITDNVSYELFSSAGSFPKVCRYNVISDNDNAGNPTDPMVYYDAYSGGSNDLLHAELNCWGDNFLPKADFFPSSMFLHLPVWCPPGENLTEPGEDEVIFFQADSLYEVGEFEQARVVFKELIDEYPQSQYSVESLKMLYSIEHLTEGNFSELQSYYLLNDSIQNDSVLGFFADFFSTKCDIELDDWIEAIEYNEERIIDPVSYQDSIFGIIDLGYIYLQMGSVGNKVTYTGHFPEFKPESFPAHFAAERNLLSLLPGDGFKEYPKRTVPRKTESSLFDNYPNPCSTTSHISFVTGSSGLARLNISNLLGERKISKEIAVTSPGLTNVDIDISSLKPGLYFYSLEIDHKPIGSKKIVVSR